MPRYNVTVTFDLRTEIEPEGVRFDNLDDPEGMVEDDGRDDQSYFSTQEVETSGGEVRFTVEAQDESYAEQVVGAVIFDGQEVEDNNGFTWLLDSVTYSVEEIEPEMDKERAKEILRDFLSGPEWKMTAEVRESLLFILDLI